MAAFNELELQVKTAESTTGNVADVRVSVYDYDENGIQLYDDLTYNLNFQTFDIENLEKRAATYSKTLRIPGTAVNNKIFSNLFDIDIEIVSSAALPQLNEKPFFGKKIECELLYDSYPIKEGFFELNKVYYNHSLRQIEYEGQFYSKSKSFTEDVGDKLLKDNENVEDDINLSYYNHHLTIENVLNSHSGTYYDESKGYYYPIIDYVNKSADNFLSIEGLRPAIYVKDVIDKIFQGAGYTYESTFFNGDYFKKLILPWAGQVKGDQEDLEAKNLKIGLNDFPQEHTDYTGDGPPNFGDGVSYSFRDFYCDSPYVYNDEEGYNKHAWVNEQEKIKAIPMDKDDIDPYYNSETNDFNTISSYFDVGSKGRYNIIWNPGVGIYLRQLINGTPQYGTNYYYSTGDKTMEIKSQLYVDKGDGNGIELLKEVTQLAQLPSELPFADANSFLGPYIVNLEWEGVLDEGWKVYPYVYIKQYNHWVNVSGQKGFYVRAWGLVQSYNTDFPSMFRVTAVDNYFIYENQLVDMNKSLPNDVKQIDFFKRIINMFNLVIDEVPNEDRKLLIETRNDYYLSGTTYDWSDKVDISQPEEIQRIETLINKDFRIRYEEDDDDYNKMYADTNRGSIYGNKVVKNPYLSKDTYDIDIDFSPTPLGNYGFSNWAVSKIFSTDDSGEIIESDFNNRILFRDNLDATSQPTEQGYITPFYLYGSGETIAFGYNPIFPIFEQHNYQPYAGHLDNPYNPTYDLNFDVSKNYYYNFNYSGMTKNNVYNVFWSDYIAELMDLNSKKVTKWIKLDITDIYNFKFNSKIWINGVLYIVEKIYDWNPGQITKVDLLKLSKYDLNTTPEDFRYYIEHRITRPPSIKRKNSKLLEMKPRYNIDLMEYVAVGTGSVSGGTFEYTISGSTPSNYQSRENIYPESAYGLIIGENNEIGSNDSIFVKGTGNKISKTANNVVVFGSDNQVDDNVKDVYITGSHNLVKSGATNITITGDQLEIEHNVSNVIVLNNISGQTISNDNYVYLPHDYTLENYYTTEQIDSEVSSMKAGNVSRYEKTGQIYYTTDEYIIGDNYNGTGRTIMLSSSYTTNGKEYLISDELGNASTNNIDIKTEGGVALINGSTTKTISTDYGNLNVYSNGTDWFTIG